MEPCAEAPKRKVPCSEAPACKTPARRRSRRVASPCALRPRQSAPYTHTPPPPPPPPSSAGRWLSRSLRLTPAGLFQLRGCGGLGRPRALLDFSALEELSVLPPPRDEAGETGGRVLVLSCSPRAGGAGGAGGATARPHRSELRLLAASYQEAAAWAAEIGAAAAEAALARSCGPTAPPPPAPRLPPRAHPEARLAAALAAAPLPALPEALAALAPEGWRWEPGRGEGAGRATALLPVLPGCATHEARALPLLAAVSGCEATRRWAHTLLMGAAGGGGGGGAGAGAATTGASRRALLPPPAPGGPRCEVARALRPQNAALAGLFAAAARPRGPSRRPLRLGTAYLPLASCAEARRVAAYGLCPAADIPRLSCTPAAAVEAGVAVLAAAAPRAAAAGAQWDAAAAATLALAVVRVAYDAGEGEGGEEASLQTAMVRKGAQAVAAAYVELVVWLRVLP